MSSQTYFICVVFLFVTFKPIVAHKGDLHHQLYQDLVAADHQSTEPHTEQMMIQQVSSPACPQPCSCKMNGTRHITSVNCADGELTMVPDVPETTVDLYLRNNYISNISCTSFKHLFSMENLDLVLNQIGQQHLPPCVFVSQSSSLINLDMSNNHIHELDVKLFQNLYNLETLNLSRNVITHLESRTFSDLVHLVNLNLSFNYIASIAPDAFTGLYSLRTLILLNNRLDNHTSFHKDVFQDLGALEMLDVKANLGSIDKAVSALRNLSHLYMEVNHNYEVLGTGFRQLTSLRVLNLNQVFFWYEERHYKKISACYFKNNHTLSSNFFGNIKTGKEFELHLSYCHIDMIENDSFLNLSTLVTLDLSDNYQMLLGLNNPSWAESLINTKISYLDLSWTYNADYHDCRKWCFIYLAKTNLKVLILKKNKIWGIDPLPVGVFPSTIEKLDLSNNRLAFKYLYTTFILSHMSDSKLKELHVNDQEWGVRTSKRISQHTSNANVDGNLNASKKRSKRSRGTGRRSSPSILSESDGMFLNGSRIINRSLSGGTMNSQHADMADPEIPVVFGKENCLRNWKKQEPEIRLICLPPDLEAIYANSAIGPLDSDSVPHIRIVNNTVLRHVEFGDNPLTTLLGPVENVPSLQFLNLSRNHCTNLSVDFFKYMVSLQTLILKENFIGFSLDADMNGLTFSTLKNLELLDVSHNLIKDISRLAFINNRNLETLDLSNNQLSEFHSTISTVRNMSFLDFSVNLLRGLSEQTCEELKLLKSRNKNFAVNLLDNRLLFTCDYLPFLYLVLSEPDIFFRVENLQFKSINGTKISYKMLADHFPPLARECLAQRFFILILIIFFVVVGTVGFCAVIYHRRWKLRYLYYIGHRRMHIGEQVIDYAPVADVFLTYDQDDLHWRRFMQRIFLPGLNQRNITYVLGETDFPGGDLMAHVTGAVVGTRKTVVLLSEDIFDDLNREYEINLSIMREMDTRSLKIVPIFVEQVDLALYPREIELFLRNQWERCLWYNDSKDFWDAFGKAVRENK